MSNELLLDTQASIHIIANPDLIEKMTKMNNPIIVQGITKDTIRVTLQGTLATVGITVYHSPHIAANILSYSKLQETHVCIFDHDTFQATPKCNGPVLTFANVNGHYIMNLSETLKIYATSIDANMSRYNK